MALVLYGLIYLAAFLMTLACIAVVCWWIRYAIAVCYCLLPVMMVFWFFWAWLVAIPMGLLFDGSGAEQQVVRISHWLNDTCVDILWFAVAFPFKLFIWAGHVAAYLSS